MHTFRATIATAQRTAELSTCPPPSITTAQWTAELSTCAPLSITTQPSPNSAFTNTDKRVFINATNFVDTKLSYCVLFSRITGLINVLKTFKIQW
jgi:hypothetical protein